MHHLASLLSKMYLQVKYRIKLRQNAPFIILLNVKYIVFSERLICFLLYAILTFKRDLTLLNLLNVNFPFCQTSGLSL